MIHQSLGRALKRRSPKQLPLEGYTSSAVLVPLFLKQGHYEVLFTQRTDQVRDHKNQISFPGGVREKEDQDLLQTALRETEEEVGLAQELVEILGQLEDIYTPTGYRITPYVGLIATPVTLTPNPCEIQSLIEVPLQHLLDPSNMTIQKTTYDNQEFDTPYFHYQEHTIWGATGRITHELIEVLRE